MLSCVTCYGDPIKGAPADVVHHDVQDEQAPGWLQLLELIEHGIRRKIEKFSPGTIIDRELWRAVVALPPQIGDLTSVTSLNLYGSNISRLPVDIGRMSALEVFTPYTSARLHWFPYEITRCKRLKSSTVSTRRLYGNEKYRPHFPDLLERPVRPLNGSKATCSVCDRVEESRPFEQYWLSLQVATDVLPLLARCCSRECFSQLPPGAEDYIRVPHTGGAQQQQPPGSYPEDEEEVEP